MSIKSKLRDEDLARMTRGELEQYFRYVESEYFRILSEHSSLMKDVNKRMQLHLTEVRSLKEVNNKVQEDNQELRDLCCFLDDDRQRGRKQSKEWQRFGRYTADVMKSEVAAYQKKLKLLEASQLVLMNENLELKQLCLDISEDRPEMLTALCSRDSGDGSSNSSLTADKPSPEKSKVDNTQPVPSGTLISDQNNTNALRTTPQNDHSKDIAVATSRFFSTPTLINTNNKPPPTRYTSTATIQLQPSPEKIPSMTIDVPLSSPAAPVHQYMKVLDVYEQLDTDVMDDEQQDIVRQLCNVVWRKLGDSVPSDVTPV